MRLIRWRVHRHKGKTAHAVRVLACASLDEWEGFGCVDVAGVWVLWTQ